MIIEAVGGVEAERYELGELLGSGGMADVYAARDRVLDRDVAIKFFRPIEGLVGQARFVSEARLLAGLSHPGLVTVYDAYLANRRPCLIMRLVDGGTLRRRIDDVGRCRPGRWPPSAPASRRRWPTRTRAGSCTASGPGPIRSPCRER